MTLTDLAGFPMVMAVSQHAINAQMAKVYEQSTKEAERFPKVPWNLGEEDGSWTLTVDEFKAPEVDFDTDVQQGCRLKMTIKTGNFSAVSIKMENKKPVPITIDTKLDGLTLYVITPMKQVVHDTWSDKFFQVQGLFADLENVKRVDLDLDQDVRVAFLGTMKASLETVLSDRLKEIGKNDPQALLFGAVKYPIIAASEESMGLLKPSASTYSTVRIPNLPNDYQRGDLNYLLLLDNNKSIPAGAAVGAFNQSLIRNNADATLVLSDALLLEKFLKPILEASWPGISLTIDRGLFDSKPAGMYLAGDLNFGLTINGRGRNAYLKKCNASVQGEKIVIDYYYETSIYALIGGDIECDVTGTQTITLTSENGILKQTIDKPTPNVHTHGNDIGRAFADILTLGFNELARKNTTSEGIDSINDFTSTILADAQTALSAFLLPGKAVWNFSSATLNGQLYIQASYKEPEPMP